MSTPCRAFNYQLCGQSLEHVFEERDLGVIIDSSLTFMPHIDSKVNIANAYLAGLIWRNFSFLDKDTLVRLYSAFVRPHLEYCQLCGHPPEPLSSGNSKRFKYVLRAGSRVQGPLL